MPSLQTFAIMGAVVAALVVAALAMNAKENATIKSETRAIVEAEGIKKTTETINAISDKAEKARAMRRYCPTVGLRLDLASGKCK